MTAIHFAANDTEIATSALGRLMHRYGQAPTSRADVIVALGGDGFLLSTLRQNLGLPVYGMNRGTVGFLMNDYDEADLPRRIRAAEETVMHPLAMLASTPEGEEHSALGINEVSLLRAGAAAAVCWDWAGACRRSEGSGAAGTGRRSHAATTKPASRNAPPMAAALRTRVTDYHGEPATLAVVDE